MKLRLADITLKVISGLGWDDSQSITQQLYKESQALSSSWRKSGRGQSWEQDLGSASFSMADKLVQEIVRLTVRPHLCLVWEGASPPKSYCIIAVTLICQVYVFQKPSIIFPIKLYKTLLVFLFFQNAPFDIYMKWCCVILWAASCENKAARLWFQFWSWDDVFCP